MRKSITAKMICSEHNKEITKQTNLSRRSISTAFCISEEV